MMDTLYTPAEVAEQLKLKKNTIYELIKRGELPSSKVGKQLRISSQDLAKYLNRTAHGQEQPESSPLKRDYLENGSGLVISGQAQALDLLCAMVQSHPDGLPVLRSYMNSYNSLYSLYFGKVHGACCSLWSPQKNDFDLSILSHFLPGIPVKAIHLCKYRLGLYVARGNPGGIGADTDLSSRNIKIVNRERGSEARRLMDVLLSSGHISPSRVAGYSKELLSHQTVAAFVAASNADAAIGDETSVFLYEGLDFIPLETASVDFVFFSDHASLPALDLIEKILCSEEWKDSLSLLAGYDTTETGKIFLQH